jgi:hypothetical protein
MKKILIILMVVSFVFVNCGGGNKTGETASDSTKVASEKTTQEYDLSANGIPVIITAPIGAEVKTGIGNTESEGLKFINYIVEKDVFKLEVTYTTGSEFTKEELINDAKDIAKEDKDFVEMVSEEPNGFIYKLKNDEGDDYNFFYLLLKDGKPIEFESGLNMENYTLDQIKTLMEAAKIAK